MSMTATKTVRELAVDEPCAARVFEGLGIDYCCGGKQTLEQACNAAGVQISKVMDALEAAKTLPVPHPARSTGKLFR